MKTNALALPIGYHFRQNFPLQLWKPESMQSYHHQKLSVELFDAFLLLKKSPNKSCGTSGWCRSACIYLFAALAVCEQLSCHVLSVHFSNPAFVPTVSPDENLAQILSFAALRQRPLSEMSSHDDPVTLLLSASAVSALRPSPRSVFSLVKANCRFRNFSLALVRRIRWFRWALLTIWRNIWITTSKPHASASPQSTCGGTSAVTSRRNHRWQRLTPSLYLVLMKIKSRRRHHLCLFPRAQDSSRNGEGTV